MEAVDTQVQAQAQAQVQVQAQEQVQAQTYNYSANVANVMSILVNSIYTDKDIFIRELISNASDAINKVCLIDNKYSVGNEIKISYNKELRQLIIQDSGCGFTKKDLVEKIGSIGTSGTKQFMETFAQSKDKLIGQFGVGVINISQFGIGVISLSQITASIYAVCQIGVAYSLIAQLGLYWDKGFGQIVISLKELIRYIT